MIRRLISRRISLPQSYCYSRRQGLEQCRYYTEQMDDDSDTLHGNSGFLRDLLDKSTAFVGTTRRNEADEWATLPYTDGTIMSKQERRELDINRPKMDPRDTSIILFPGERSHFRGMAKLVESVPAAKDLFDCASEILKYDVLELCNQDPKKLLNDIRYNHIAIVTTSLAALELLREERPNAVFNCVATAGFGLGEITALVFAGAFDFEESLSLIQLRAEAIHAASEMNSGGMAKVRITAASKLHEALNRTQEWCINNDVEPDLSIAQFMYPGLKILAGSDEALKYLETNLNIFRLRAVKRMKGEPACYSPLMQPTVEPITKALQQMHISDPLIHVYSNVTGKYYMNAAHIIKQLPQQLVKAIKWEQTMHGMYARRINLYPRTIVCGPGYHLRSILQRTNFPAWRDSVHVLDSRKLARLGLM